MAYERLTSRDEEYGIITLCDRCSLTKKGQPCTLAEMEHGETVKCIDEAYCRLAELEDMIESGQAVILPCNVGDQVYAIFQDYAHKNDYAFFKEKVDEIRIMQKDIYICLSCGEDFHEERNADQFGVTLFTTKEAAEAKLKELREVENDDKAF